MQFDTDFLNYSIRQLIMHRSAMTLLITLSTLLLIFLFPFGTVSEELFYLFSPSR